MNTSSHFASLSRRPWVFLALIALAIAGCSGNGEPKDELVMTSELGSFLAARQAERDRDFGIAAQFILGALDENPDNYDMMVRAETFLVADGRFPDAVRLAERIVRFSPGHPQSALLLAVAAAQKGDFTAAEKALEGQPLTAINRIVLPLMNGWIQAGQARPAAAINALRPILEAAAFRPLYEYHAALINDFSGRLDAADEHYRQSLASEGGTPARLIEAAGNYYERTGRREDARALYEKFQSESRDSAAINASLQRLATNGGVPARLIPTAQIGMAEALFNIAGALRQENSPSSALVYAQLALVLAPDLPVGLLLAADILDSSNQRAKANEVYARIPQSSPLGWAARVRIAENLHVLGRTDDAVRELERMAAERPDRIEPLVSLGQILRAKERYADAASVYTRAIARLRIVEPRHWALFYTRGIAHERSKQWPKAEADFLRALELQPEQPDVLNYLAYSWVDQGLTQRYVQARQMLERAVALRPTNGAIIDSLGWVLYRTGFYREAVEVLERAVELVPEDSTLLDHLGDAYWRVGRFNEARFQWQRALQHKPEPDARVEIERKLQRGLAPMARSGT